MRAIFSEAKAREERNSNDFAGTFSGVCIAYFLPAATARTLVLRDGERADDLHMTLVMLKRTADQFSAAEQRALKRCVRDFASEAAPLHGQVAQVSRFPVKDGKYPLIATVDMPDVQAWRERLVTHLATDGFAVDMTYPDFKPHITLAYRDEGTAMPHVDLPDVPLTLDALTLAIGPQRTTFPVGDEQYPRAADPVGQLAERLAALVDARANETFASLRAAVLAHLPE